MAVESGRSEIDEAIACSAGFDPKRLRKVVRLVEEGAQRDLYPGAAYLVGRRDQIVLEGACGYLDPEKTRPAQVDSIYDMASVTKPILTASALLTLLEDGKVHLGMPVTHFFPDRKLPHLAEVTLRHLVTHTSGLPAWRDMYTGSNSREEVVEKLFSIPLANPVGSAYVYSCLGYIMLGLAIESVAGVSLVELARSRVFGPLGMDSTCCNPGPDLMPRIAATAHCPARRRTMYGEVHDGNAWSLGGVSGNAGLFSCVHDLARYCRMILEEGAENWNQGTTDPIFSPLGIRLMKRNLIDPSIGGQTLGWFIYPNDMLPAGDMLSRATIGHSGFTGTSVVIDPEQQLYALLLTNRVCRDDDGLAFRWLRRVFHNLIAQAIISW